MQSNEHLALTPAASTGQSNCPPTMNFDHRPDRRSRAKSAVHAPAGYSKPPVARPLATKLTVEPSVMAGFEDEHAQQVDGVASKVRITQHRHEGNLEVVGAVALQPGSAELGRGLGYGSAPTDGLPGPAPLTFTEPSNNRAPVRSTGPTDRNSIRRGPADGYSHHPDSEACEEGP